LPIQAPETPKVISTNGPRQQAEARSPAIPPTAREAPPDLDLNFDMTLTPVTHGLDEIRLLP